MSGNHALETTSLWQQRGLIIGYLHSLFWCPVETSTLLQTGPRLWNKQTPQRIFVNETERNIDLSNGTQVAAGRISARLQNALCHKFSQRFVVVKLFLIDGAHNPLVSDKLHPSTGCSTTNNIISLLLGFKPCRYLVISLALVFNLQK